jgi:hypothetical protein
MNEQDEKDGAADCDAAIEKAVIDARAQAAGETPPANLAGQGAPLGLDAGGSGAPPVGTLDPSVVARTLGKLARMGERIAVRGLYRLGLRASGGDRAFAEGIAAEWAWSNDDWQDVDALTVEVVRMYSIGSIVRPDLALAVAAGGHLVGYVTLHKSLLKRAATAAKEANDAEKRVNAGQA